MKPVALVGVVPAPSTIATAMIAKPAAPMIFALTS